MKPTRTGGGSNARLSCNASRDQTRVCTDTRAAPALTLLRSALVLLRQLSQAWNNSKPSAEIGDPFPFEHVHAVPFVYQAAVLRPSYELSEPYFFPFFFLPVAAFFPPGRPCGKSPSVGGGTVHCDQHLRRWRHSRQPGWPHALAR